ncbi:hypothetical protein JW968_05240 [Candidatus Woesearchaeota archaeon]|nr:hypothetical protein [Candidatus Woesearchaeota archaeon]
MVENEPEMVIEDYLIDNGYKYNNKVQLVDLKGTSKYPGPHQFKPDFYLERYDIYIEFAGKLASKKYRKQKQKKTDIYNANNVPVFWITWETLGQLEWFFDFGMRMTLYDHKKWLALVVYQIKNFGVINWIILGFFIYLIVAKPYKWISAIVLLAFLIYHIIMVYKEINRGLSIRNKNQKKNKEYSIISAKEYWK